MVNTSSKGDTEIAKTPQEDKKLDRKSQIALFDSKDDDPDKKFEFTELNKIMADIKTGTTTVGSVIGAMVHQINSNHQQRHKQALEINLHEKKFI